jgi:hypothetical protein
MTDTAAPSWLRRTDPAIEAGEAEATRRLAWARRRAEAIGARLLAAKECPEDLKEWGRAHGIPSFAEMTWQAGFLAGMAAAQLDRAEGSMHDDPGE